MKPFKLQSVLDYRKLLKNIAHQELSTVISLEKEILFAINSELSELDQLYDDLEERQKIGITPHELSIYENRLSHKSDHISLLKEELEKTRQEIEKRRQTLYEASKDKKVLDTLKEKHITDQEQQYRKKETIATDEVALRIHKR